MLRRSCTAAGAEHTLLPRFAPITIVALLTTRVLIFAFQTDNISGKALLVALIAVVAAPAGVFQCLADVRVDEMAEGPPTHSRSVSSSYDTDSFCTADAEWPGIHRAKRTRISSSVTGLAR